MQRLYLDGTSVTLVSLWKNVGHLCAFVTGTQCLRFMGENVFLFIHKNI
jgi:hypothetical protein